MFEHGRPKVPSPESIARLEEGFEASCPTETPESNALVERICEASRAENRAAAARFDGVAELYALRLRNVGGNEEWIVNLRESVSAEVAAALNISRGLALSSLDYGLALRERLPQVGRLFRAGELDFSRFATIVYRTDLIVDRDILAAVDAELARKVPRWGSLSQGQLSARVDKIVARHDRDAVRRRKDKIRKRAVDIWDSGDGVAEIRGWLRSLDGQALDKRLDALAATVCREDPRTKTQRRADAMGALAAGSDRLACECGRADCAAGAKPAASPAVIYVVADQGTVDGTDDAPAATIDCDWTFPAELVSELAKSAKVVPLIHPEDAPPEPGYTPSKALADFVRCRDITCRWPGCEHPAVDCDLDHTIPYNKGGPTHASNLKCYCRLHHLMKTFCGWRDQQLRDGTVIVTSPLGETYVTTPGSAMLFPGLCKPTGEIALPTGVVDDRCGERTAMMPKRRRTYAQNRAAYIAAERKQNQRAREAAREAHRALLFGPHPPGNDDDDPPPF
ncbi:HNH endonuclease signature motif containing protein [Mycobacterium hubeiense]|uniref:HNH endonuclease signature motif containing protein n=1 Tax=Mycobacterium hubeiense TaxID=1867256 RepID=UPI000C7F26E0|nr:HNH endonuclease signature motif containing protein [Mycobacterium sp. QGD 101]